MKHSPFYTSWSIVFLTLVVIAFAPRYWLPLIDGKTEISATIHWHAVFASCWIVFFFVQSLLIARKNVGLHQKLGLASVLLAIGVFITGVDVSFGLVEKALIRNPAGAKPSLLINLLDILMFAVIYTTGLVRRRETLMHKRLMTLAALVLLNAAFFRIGVLFIGPGLPSILLAIVITSSAILAYALLEKRHSMQPNKLFWKIALAVIFIHIIRIPLAITPQWAKLVDWMLEVW